MSGGVDMVECIGCGCTEGNACIKGGEPCHWIVIDHEEGIGVCSECPEQLDEFYGRLDTAEEDWKITLKDIRIAKSALTDEIYAGKLDKKEQGWLCKKEVTQDFYRCVIQMFLGHRTEITDGKGNKYSVSVRKEKKS